MTVALNTLTFTITIHHLIIITRFTTTITITTTINLTWLISAFHQFFLSPEVP
jgi:hypothetical protein